MRAKKLSDILKPDAVLAVASHAAMGVALGLVFAMVLIETPFFGIRTLISTSDNPAATMTMFLGTVVSMFGIGATLTGVILMLENV